MYLQARIRFLLAKPAETSLVELSLAGQWKGDDSDPLWAGFKFDVPSFHSTVFWECKLVRSVSEADKQGRRRSSTTSCRR